MKWIFAILLMTVSCTSERKIEPQPFPIKGDTQVVLPAETNMENSENDRKYFKSEELAKYQEQSVLNRSRARYHAVFLNFPNPTFSTENYNFGKILWNTNEKHLLHLSFPNAPGSNSDEMIFELESNPSGSEKTNRWDDVMEHKAFFSFARSGVTFVFEDALGDESNLYKNINLKVTDMNGEILISNSFEVQGKYGSSISCKMKLKSSSIIYCV